jgi:hypothetical protein
MTFFFGDTERRIAWKGGDWYFADTQRYLGQIQQKSDGEPGSGETLTFLRKAEIDEMIEHARKHCTVATVEETTPTRCPATRSF